MMIFIKKVKNVLYLWIKFDLVDNGWLGFSLNF